MRARPRRVIVWIEHRDAHHGDRPSVQVGVAGGVETRERFSREHNKGWAWRRRCQGAGRRRAWWSGGLLRQRGGAEPYSPPTSRAQIIVERGTDLGPPVRSVLDLHPRRLVRGVRRRRRLHARWRSSRLVSKV